MIGVSFIGPCHTHTTLKRETLILRFFSWLLIGPKMLRNCFHLNSRVYGSTRRERFLSLLLMPVRCVLGVILLCVMAVLLGLALLPIPTRQRKTIGGLSWLVRFQSQIIYRVSKLRCWSSQTIGVFTPNLLACSRLKTKKAR